MTSTLTQPTTSHAGRRVQQRRYPISAGTRALYPQRIDGRVALVDVPVDHAGQVLLVERHVESHAELEGIVAAYVEHSRHADTPASWPAEPSSTPSPTASTPRQQQRGVFTGAWKPPPSADSRSAGRSSGRTQDCRWFVKRAVSSWTAGRSFSRLGSSRAGRLHARRPRRSYLG
jgi:hypothetical protein